jgi:hypothetical protein
MGWPRRISPVVRTARAPNQLATPGLFATG